MKTIMFFVCLFCLAGCSLIQQTTDNVAPQLLVQYPLPAVPQEITAPVFKLEMDLYILEDGSVGKVNLLNSSGNKTWDEQAIATILKWRYSTARVDSKSVKIWLHQTALVESVEAKFVYLAEILCPTDAEADSVYSALAEGKNFDELAAAHSISPSREKNGDLGKVDIRVYPEYIRMALADLGTDQYTKPLKYGDHYIIFKRVNK